MRSVFVGAVEGSRRAFEALIAAGERPALLVTLPLSAASRHSDFADLASIASEAGIAVHLTRDINSAETLAAVAAQAPDVVLVIGWSQICRRPFLNIPRIGAVGYHPAPLPKMRGRAVIPWTILTEQTETGSTLFWLDERMDAGDILMQRRIQLGPRETARSLYDLHGAALSEMLPTAMRALREGLALRIAQNHFAATWCARRTAEDGLIDWRQPAADVERLIRAVGEPYPGAFTLWRGGVLHIDRADLSSDSASYIGLAGQVMHVGSSAFVVRCGDGGCINVTAWRYADAGFPKLHAKLGALATNWTAA